MRPASWVAIGGTILITAGAFVLSFSALTDLAWRSGFDSTPLSMIWALVVDGLILTSTVAVVALRGNRSIRFAWALLASAATVSIVANAIHPLLPPGPVHPGIAAAVALVPPLALLSVTHLTVILGRPHVTTPTIRPQVQPLAAPAPLEHTAPETDPYDGDGDDSSEPDATPDINRATTAHQLRNQGLSYRDIGKQLGVSDRTIRRDLKQHAAA